MPGLIFAAIIFKTTTRWTLTFLRTVLLGGGSTSRIRIEPCSTRVQAFFTDKRRYQIYSLYSYLWLHQGSRQSVAPCWSTWINWSDPPPSQGMPPRSRRTPSKLIRLSQSASAFQVIQRNDCKLSWQDWTNENFLGSREHVAFLRRIKRNVTRETSRKSTW